METIVYQWYLSSQSGLLNGCFFLKSLTIFKVFVALGNNHPQILVNLEDKILEGIVTISEGTSPKNVLDSLYSEVLLVEKDLSNDVEAMTWFNLLTPNYSLPSTPPPSVFPFLPNKCAPIFPVEASKASQSVNYLGLASPPASLNNTPFSVGSTKTTQMVSLHHFTLLIPNI